MGYTIAIVGNTGTGKSTSIEKLPSDKTFVINVMNKPLPWRGARQEYTKENKNTAVVSQWNEVVGLLNFLKTNRTDLETIIIDDAGYIMTFEYFKRANETGYGKFSALGAHMVEVFTAAKDMPDTVSVVFMFHSEDVIAEGTNPSKRIKTVGKMVSDSFTPEALFSVVLYTHVEYDEKAKPIYQFVTNHTPQAPAKSPKGMFEDLYIPNDLNFVITKIKEY